MLAYSQVRGRPVHTLDTAQEIREYLASRGISVELASALDFKITKASTLISASRGGPEWEGDTRWAIVMPHFAADGSKLPWWSARLVGRALPAPLRAVASFADYVDQAQAVGQTGMGKMFCPPNEPPCAYLPTGQGLPAWLAIPQGSSIFIHESAIKAINGAALGYYSVGLNGVWGFGSKKHGLALVDGLKSLPWKARELNPIILFDTNIETSAQVQEAAKQLASRLLAITGRTARLLKMPPRPSGEDMGFDDYVQAVGTDLAGAFLASATTEAEAIEVSAVELLKLELNSRCAVVSSLGRIANIATGTLMTRPVFTDVTYAHYTADIENAAGNMMCVNVPKLWLADSRSTRVSALVYEPGLPSLVPGPQGQDLNTWRGWGTTATPADVTPWLDLLASNVKDPIFIDWILDWLAYPIQFPGKKLSTLMLIFGPSGTGKDRFLRPMHIIYGRDNTVEISNDELRSSFTSLYAQRQFVHANELKRVKDAADQVNQKIKALVTSTTLTYNKKGEPEYKVRNTVNLAITSNYYDCVKLDEDDRRATVIRWEPVSPISDHRGDQHYWAAYSKWVEADGAKAIFHFLQTRDLSRFDPDAWSLSSAAKAEVVDAARTPIQRFVAELKSGCPSLPPYCEGRQLFTAKELAIHFYEGLPSPGQSHALADEMRNQGIQKANGGKKIKARETGELFWVVPQDGLPAQDWSSPAVCTAHIRIQGAKK